MHSLFTFNRWSSLEHTVDCKTIKIIISPFIDLFFPHSHRGKMNVKPFRGKSFLPKKKSYTISIDLKEHEGAHCVTVIVE